MARKNIFTTVMHEGTSTEEEHDAPSNLKRFGAARSMSNSIDELAKQAAKIAEGETVIELDPDALDASFVSDRFVAEDGDEEYRDLLVAIKERGQDSPILVRPHPDKPGRYMIVFGHRRVRAARELGRSVRAVVKSLDDQHHVISQGQENSARANLTFIERVLFAERLESLGYSRDVIQASLSIDYASLSKMLTIPRSIPNAVLAAIGSAKGVGRDRWLELRKLIEVPKNAARAKEFILDTEFTAAPSGEHFDLLFNHLKPATLKTPVKKVKGSAATSWSPADRSVTVAQKKGARSMTIILAAQNGPAFGTWINNNLEGLYEAFQKNQQISTGE